MVAPRIAYFVTPHGLGHAARSAAVIEALAECDRDLAFEIVTRVPNWFFEQSLSAPHRLRDIATDVGLIQIDPFRADLDATVSALEAFWSGLDRVADRLIADWGASTPRLVVSDISPLGLAVAARLGVPSVLVENFTWDTIYEAYLEETPALAEFARRSAEMVRSATVHIQCEPMCRAAAGAVRVAPIGRSARSSVAETRAALGLDATDPRPLVLLTLGGLGWGERAPETDGEHIFVALGGTDRASRRGDLIHLPNHSPVYPPDIVRAADAVVARLGYSTVVECYRAGTRLGYIGRPGFPEAPVLESFVRANLSSIDVTRAFESSGWTRRIAELLELPPGTAREENGADDVADRVLDLLS